MATQIHKLKNALLQDPINYKETLGKGSFGSVYRIETTKGSVAYKSTYSSKISESTARNEAQKCQLIVDKYFEHMKTCSNKDQKTCTHPSHSLPKLILHGKEHVFNRMSTDRYPVVYKCFSGKSAQRIYYDQSHINELQQLSLAKTKVIIIKLFEAIDFLHSLDIIHCDISMGNLLIKHLDDISRLKIQLIDLGLSEFYSKSILGTHKQTSLYRHPLSDLKVPLDYIVDLWSIGCILFELIAEQPLFMFFENDENRPFEREKFIALIEQINGPMPIELLEKGNNVNQFYHKNKNGSYSFKHPQFTPKGLTTKSYIEKRLLQAAERKGYDHFEIIQLSDLITSLVSYTPPSCKKALKYLKNPTLKLSSSIQKTASNVNKSLKDNHSSLPVIKESFSIFQILFYLKNLLLQVINSFLSCFIPDYCGFTCYSKEEVSSDYYSASPAIIRRANLSTQ